MSDTTREYMAARIREFRKERGLSTDELGELVGRSKSAVESWETGRTQPDADKLIELCRIFHVDIPDFYDPSLTAKSSSRGRIVKDPEAVELVDLYGRLDPESKHALMLVVRSLVCGSQGPKPEH